MMTDISKKLSNTEFDKDVPFFSMKEKLICAFGVAAIASALLIKQGKTHDTEAMNALRDALQGADAGDQIEIVTDGVTRKGKVFEGFLNANNRYNCLGVNAAVTAGEENLPLIHKIKGESGIVRASDWGTTAPCIRTM